MISSLANAIASPSPTPPSSSSSSPQPTPPHHTHPQPQLLLSCSLASFRSTPPQTNKPPIHGSSLNASPRPNPSSMPPPRRTHLARASDSPATPLVDDEWIQKLPEKNKPLYSHSLPCIEAWLKSLGFFQSKEDRAEWLIERSDWHAHLSLDITDLYIRYLKSGPGNLERDVERKFSYALSREDLENAILGGP